MEKENRQQIKKLQKNIINDLGLQTGKNPEEVKTLVCDQCFMDDIFKDYSQSLSALGIDQESNNYFIEKTKNQLKTATVEEKVIFALTTLVAKEATDKKTTVVFDKNLLI